MKKVFKGDAAAGGRKRLVLKPAFIVNPDIDGLVKSIFKETFALTSFQETEIRALEKIEQKIQAMRDDLQVLSDEMVVTQNRETMQTMLASAHALEKQVVVAKRELQDLLDNKTQKTKTQLIRLKDALIDIVRTGAFGEQDWKAAFPRFQALSLEQLNRNRPNNATVNGILMNVGRLFLIVGIYKENLNKIQEQENATPKKDQMEIKMLSTIDEVFEKLIFENLTFDNLMDKKINKLNLMNVQPVLKALIDIDEQLMDVKEYAEKEQFQIEAAAHAKENQRLRAEEVRAPLLPSHATEKVVAKGPKVGENFIGDFRKILKSLEDNKSNIEMALTIAKFSKFKILMAMLEQIDFKTDKQFVEAIRELKDIDALLQKTSPIVSKVSGTTTQDKLDRFKKDFNSEVTKLDDLLKKRHVDSTPTLGFPRHPE